MKLSIIKPLLKKGSSTELANNRPISLLTASLKILEKIIYKRLYSYLIMHNLLCEKQFGFGEKLLTYSATIALINSILSSLGEKKFGGAFFVLLIRPLTV